MPVLDRELGLVDERVVVQQLLERLPERDRAVVELRFFEGLGQEEIATRIGVSQSYLSRMLRRSSSTSARWSTNRRPMSLTSATAPARSRADCLWGDPRTAQSSTPMIDRIAGRTASRSIGGKLGSHSIRCAHRGRRPTEADDTMA